MASVSGANTSTISLSDGRKLAYRLSGQAADESPIILLSNSLLAPYRTWDKYAEHLESRNFRVLCYDQVGHGGSTYEASSVDSTTFTTLASDVRELLDTLKIKQLHAWIGISMGAATGFYFAIQNPGRIRRLVLADTISSSPAAAGIADPFEPRVQTARSEAKVDTLVEATISRWFSESWRNSNDDEVQRMRNIMRQTQVEGFVACCRALQDKNFDMRPLVSQIGSSVEDALIVVGELDANLPATMAVLRDQIQSGFKESGKDVVVGYTLIKAAGHVSVIDGLEDYKTVVTKFLEN